MKCEGCGEDKVKLIYKVSDGKYLCEDCRDPKLIKPIPLERSNEYGTR